MQRKRLWTLATVLLLAAGCSTAVVQPHRASVQTSVKHTTVEDLTPHVYSQVDPANDGEVALLRIGIAGEWTSPTVQGLPPVYGTRWFSTTGMST